MKPLLLIIEPSGFSSEAEHLLSRHFETIKINLIEDLEKYASRTSIIFVRLGVGIDEKFIERFKALEYVVSPTTGLDHIDLNYCESKNIKVLSLRGETKFLEGIPSTAELAFGLILSLARNIPSAVVDVKIGGWNRDKYRGIQLKGKSLGILGLGRIGKMLARYALAFEMKISYCDPYVDCPGYEQVDMAELFAMNDIVVNCLPLNAETQGMIKFTHFQHMKPSAFFINIARDKIIEEGALLKALNRGCIAGAALDVIDGEQMGSASVSENKLVQYSNKNPNLIITPHLGGATREAMRDTELFISEKLIGQFDFKACRQ